MLTQSNLSSQCAQAQDTCVNLQRTLTKSIIPAPFSLYPLYQLLCVSHCTRWQCDAVKHTHTMHRHVIAGMTRELDIWSRYHPGNVSSVLPEEARLHGAVYFVHAKTWEALIHDPSTRHRLHICMSM